MNIIEKKYGKLKVLEKTNKKAKNNGEFMYKCICECGNICLIRGSNLKNGNTKSCGCTRKNNIKNNIRNKRLYIIYSNMKQRCYNENKKEYKYYGAKGIKICEEWLNNYKKFEEWALNNGYNDNLTIDRINNSDDYKPENCRWSTYKQQANNMSTNRHITYKNETKTLAEWADILNFSQPKLKYRLDNWDVEKAFMK